VNDLPVHGFEKTVEEVLLAPKAIQTSMNWRDGQHGDYVTCDLPVFVPTMPQARVRLSMTAHVRKLPRKCTFLLIYGERIFALDVNPARAHNNRTAALLVECSHWTRWPCEEVEPDHRDLIHHQWFNEFLTRTNISFYGKYERPPYLPEQVDILL
jgi:hypothetical protein